MISPYSHDKWPAGYRRLLYVALTVAAALAAYGWLYILPKWRDYADLQEEVQTLEEESQDNQWPKDPQVLQKYLNLRLQWTHGTDKDKKQVFLGLKEEERRIQNRATKYLRQKIVENFPVIAHENDWTAIENFMHNSSRIDFKYLANRLEADFAAKRLTIPEDIVQFTESKKEPVYQRILQLWVVEFLLQKLEENQLQIVSLPEQGMADIQLQPPVGFVLDSKDTDPFLWEFPVTVTVQGTIQDFLRLQRTLISRKVFFPIRNLSVHTYPPPQLPPKQDHLDINRQTITFTISSFFLPRLPQETPAPKKEKQDVPPNSSSNLQ